jgi:hypothetical protein
VGQWEGIHYLTMPLLRGRSLADWIRTAGPLPEMTAAKLACKAARALRVAHEAGVIHRDLKPSNILVNPEWEPIIIDFGLAQRQVGEEARLTSTGGLRGAPAYLAPEQIEGQREAGPHTDIYCLGAVLYEMLAGRAPFSGWLWEVIEKVQREEPPPLSALRPDVSPKLEAICRRAMSNEPQDRFASMAEFAQELAEFLVQGGQPLLASREAAPRPSISPAKRPSHSRLAPWLLVPPALGVLAWLAILKLSPLSLNGQRDPAGGRAPSAASPPAALDGARADLLPAGSVWEGTFVFRPPIDDDSGEVHVRITHRQGPLFQGVYTTEGGNYSWRIAGELRGRKIEWRFTEAIRDHPGGTLVGRAFVAGALTGERMQVVFRMPQNDSAAETHLTRRKPEGNDAGPKGVDE